MTEDARLDVRLAIGATGGVAATGIAVLVAGSGNTGEGMALAAIARGLMVAAPIAVGLWAWHNRPDERFGQLLVAAGFGWFFTTLAESGHSLPYSVGRVAAWAVECGIVYLVLSFPSGRLREGVDRKLFCASIALVATLYLPTALLSDSFPVPSPYTTCDGGCPSNAFFLGSEPQFVDSVLRPLREVLTVLLFLAVTARLAQRWQGASTLMRRTLDPVLAVASFRCVALATAVLARLALPDSHVPGWLSWAIALALPVLAVAFSLGLLWWRLYSADALTKIGNGARATQTPAELRDCVSDALVDPTLRLYCWSEGITSGRWADEQGVTAPAPAPRPGQSVTEVRDGDRLVAAIVHDAALDHDRDFLDAVAAFALIALKNEQLSATVDSSLREIRESRSRIVATADRERRRIERDLHDGAQQRLVALRVQLELTEELIQQDQQRGLEKLHGLGGEIDATLDEIRALARGVYPPLLSDSGLAEALAAAARKGPLAVTVQPDGASGRYPSDVENAVYFCCLEAMQNASKHATGAERVTVSLVADDDALRFRVEDDGAGFDLAAHGDGAGLTNMRDRMAAVGGELTVASAPGEGAVVSGSVSFDAMRSGLDAGPAAPVRDLPA